MIFNFKKIKETCHSCPSLISRSAEFFFLMCAGVGVCVMLQSLQCTLSLGHDFHTCHKRSFDPCSCFSV